MDIYPAETAGSVSSRGNKRITLYFLALADVCFLNCKLHTCIHNNDWTSFLPHSTVLGIHGICCHWFTYFILPRGGMSLFWVGRLSSVLDNCELISLVRQRFCPPHCTTGWQWNTICGLKVLDDGSTIPQTMKNGDIATTDLTWVQHPFQCGAHLRENKSTYCKHLEFE